MGVAGAVITSIQPPIMGAIASNYQLSHDIIRDGLPFHAATTQNENKNHRRL
jgi:hypothetical protein